MQVRVRWSDEIQKIKLERKSIVVFVDVLRTASTLCYGLDSNASSLIITKDINNALALKENDPKTTLIAGERGGIQLDGFDVGNSPYLISQKLKKSKKKKKLVLCTGNFSSVIGNMYSSKAVTYVIGCLANAKSLAAYIARKKPSYLYIVPVGTYYMTNYKGKLPVYTEEDLVGSLYILTELMKIRKDLELEERELEHLAQFDAVLRNQKKLSQFLQHTLYAESLKSQDKTLGNKKGRIKNINQKDMEFCFRCNKLTIIPKLYKEKGLYLIKRR
jgi:phosphosulfolactate phosphohydrolase-like enzyme